MLKNILHVQKMYLYYSICLRTVWVLLWKLLWTLYSRQIRFHLAIVAIHNHWCQKLLSWRLCAKLFWHGTFIIIEEVICDFNVILSIFSSCLNDHFCCWRKPEYPLKIFHNNWQTLKNNIVSSTPRHGRVSNSQLELQSISICCVNSATMRLWSGQPT